MKYVDIQERTKRSLKNWGQNYMQLDKYNSFITKLSKMWGSLE